jgi:ribosome-binding protein aMBF1 (putative translation factor)
MSGREAKHVRRSLTPDERRRIVEARKLIAADEPEIRQKASAFKKQHDQARSTLHDAVKLLKEERQRAGLSLAELADRTGIERPNLSRLENDDETNPTIATLTRYADALGKRLLIVLADQSPAT